MRTYNLRFLPEAEDELREVRAFVGADSSPDAARWIERFLEAIASLGTLPKRFPVLDGAEEFASPPHRMVFERYRVIYAIDEEAGTVTILYVQHNARRAPDLQRLRT